LPICFEGTLYLATHEFATMHHPWREEAPPSQTAQTFNSVRIIEHKPNESRYSKRIPPEAWNAQKPFLESLHSQGFTRAEMVEQLAGHGFTVTKNRLDNKMNEWGFGRYKRHPQHAPAIENDPEPASSRVGQHWPGDSNDIPHHDTDIGQSLHVNKIATPNRSSSDLGPRTLEPVVTNGDPRRSLANSFDLDSVVSQSMTTSTSAPNPVYRLVKVAEEATNHHRVDSPSFPPQSMNVSALSSGQSPNLPSSGWLTFTSYSSFPSLLPLKKRFASQLDQGNVHSLQRLGCLLHLLRCPRLAFDVRFLVLEHYDIQNRPGELTVDLVLAALNCLQSATTSLQRQFSEDALGMIQSRLMQLVDESAQPQWDTKSFLLFLSSELPHTAQLDFRYAASLRTLVGRLGNTNLNFTVLTCGDRACRTTLPCECVAHFEYSQILRLLGKDIDDIMEFLRIYFQENIDSLRFDHLSSSIDLETALRFRLAWLACDFRRDSRRATRFPRLASPFSFAGVPCSFREEALVAIPSIMQPELHSRLVDMTVQYRWRGLPSLLAKFAACYPCGVARKTDILSEILSDSFGKVAPSHFDGQSVHGKTSDIKFEKAFMDMAAALEGLGGPLGEYLYSTPGWVPPQFRVPTGPATSEAALRQTDIPAHIANANEPSLSSGMYRWSMSETSSTRSFRRSSDRINKLVKSAFSNPGKAFDSMSICSEFSGRLSIMSGLSFRSVRSSSRRSLDPLSED
jgi:hypothetical protein